MRPVRPRLDPVTHYLLTYGLIILFTVVAVESAGVPFPGETALIVAAVLAQRGHFSLVAVIAVGAAGAIVGDNVGYWIGRKGGRALLRKTPIVRDYFERVLPPTERFFARHGPKTVFVGRFIAVLRVTAAWVAGISHMPWWRFLIWNAAGGIAWSILVSVVAYEFGQAAADTIGRFGLYGAAAIAALVVVGLVIFRISRRRVLKDL